ncbi:hypothetical protein CBS101457_006318 [Exobasidium rhododendri]|nr:hypothetical protein CBS101457_006318 [Exobasidium rhododendri]
MQGRRGTALIVAVLLIIQLACWRGTNRLRSTSTLLKRSWEDQEGTRGHVDGKNESAFPLQSGAFTFVGTPTSSPVVEQSVSPVACEPLPFASTAQDICDHVRLHCPASGHLDYLRFYYCIGLEKSQGTAEPTLQHILGFLDSGRPFVEEMAAVKVKAKKTLSAHLTALRVVALACIIAWMLFLFSWVGVVASDFFCPNLGTISARLGLSESTAGVTFLAFGNGSPDVFSTFGAMKTGSGSLAIGELIGAASFIVSVISGSMMLIAPFRVKAYPFIRDVGFFTVAVAMTMIFLIDGELHFNECLGMIALYLTYATLVIVGSWWQERQKRKRLLMSTIRSEFDTTSQEATTPQDTERMTSQHELLHPTASPVAKYSRNSPNEYDPDVDPFSRWQQVDASQSARSGGSQTQSPLLTGHDVPSTSNAYSNAALSRLKSLTGARHSLLGAVEFRDVVRSLQQEALADRSVEIYQSRDPERFLPHHHHHDHSHQQQQQQQLLHPDSATVSTPIRSHRQRSHERIQSLKAFEQAALNANQSHSIESTRSSKPGLFRSRSTTGTRAGPSNLSGDQLQSDQDWSMTKQSQPSAYDATAAAAVDDPWKEHDANDNCEQMLLPPPAQSLSGSDMDGEERRVAKPKLEIRTEMSDQRRPNRGRAYQKRSNSGDSDSSNRTGSRVAHQTGWQRLKRVILPIFKVLFPSLSHFHDKSWLGIIIGIITAPAITILNLTLPVVDDEAESAAMMGEKVLSVDDVGYSPSGRIQLKGSEGDLYATVRRNGDGVAGRVREEDNDDDDNNDDEHIITLKTATPPPNPWSGSDVEGEETDQAGSALRRLAIDTSALINNRSASSESQKRLRKSSSPAPANELASDRRNDEIRSISDSDSCDSHDSLSGEDFHLFLVLAQCVFAPPFIVWSICTSADSDHIALKTLIAFFAGIGVAVFALLIVLRFRRSMTEPPLGFRFAVGWTRVAVGFLVSILYIMSIVDEVVSILQTLGLILGLSDAILGLTVFAMGNSLGDLVANITIARMGHPVMAISACFAGPLLNLLLGIGISGTWLLSGNRIATIPNQPGIGASRLSTLLKRTHEDGSGMYHIDFSPTLTVSGVGLLLILLIILIAVPLNGFYLNRTIGHTLIVTYGVIMTVNVLVEIYYVDRSLHR